MADFNYNSRRDASPAIRGFYYQFLLCVELWLTLKPGEHLFLEHGEDIDRLVEDAGGDGSKLRELIQVKDVTDSVTIRSATARETLANLYQHIHSNPALELKYLFYTSAKAGKERPRVCELGPSMLVLWNGASMWDPKSKERGVFLQSLRRFVGDAQLPDGYDEDNWRAFKDFAKTSDDDVFWNYVLALRWAFEQGDWEDRRQAILSMIAERKMVTEGVDAALLASFLVSRLLERTCSKDRSPLTKHDLEQALASFDGMASPAGVWATVHKELSDLSFRVQTLETRMQEVEQQTSALALQIGPEVGSEDYGNAEVVLGGASELQPALPSYVSERGSVVARITKVLDKHRGIVLWGSTGQGKTTLALLVAKRLGQTPLWLEASPEGGEPTVRFLLDQLALHAARPFDPADREWLADACRLISFRGLPVIDRLVTARHDHPAYRLSTGIAGNAIRTGGKVICLSHHEPIGQLWEPWERIGAAKLPVPEMVAADVMEIATSLGAPEEFTRGVVCQSIAPLSRGHPVLIQASLQFLRDRSWQHSNKEFESLLKGEYKDEVVRQALQRFAASVADTDSRKLLYRLDVVGGMLTSGIATRVAAVQPEIERASERLSGLIGAWLRRLGEDKYEVTPLISGMGQKQLGPDELKGVHKVAARSILERRSLSHNEAVFALGHLASAGESDRFVRLFVQALQSALKYALDKPEDVRAASGVLLGAWAESSLPAEIADQYQLHIRASQIALRQRVGLDTEYLVNEFLALFHRVGEEHLIPKALSALLFVQAHGKDRFDEAVGVAISLNRAWPSVEMTTETEEADLYANARVWMAVGLSLGAKTVSQMSTYVAYLNELTPIEVQALEKDGPLFACYWLPILMATAGIADKEAREVSGLLSGLSTQAGTAGHQLVATALLARSYFLRFRGKEEYQKVLQEGRQVAEGYGSDHVRVVWQLSELAEGLFTEEKNAEALQVYKTALSTPGWKDAHDRAQAALFAAISAERVGQRADRMTLLNEALQSCADRSQHLLPHDEVAIRGELALAMWEEHKPHDSMRQIESALESLVHSDDLTREVRAVAVSIRLMLGAITVPEIGVQLQQQDSIAELNKYMKTGAFVTDYEGRASKYTNATNLESLACLATLAEAKGDHEIAQRVAAAAYALAREQDDRFRECMMGLQISAALLRDDKIEEVLDIGCRGASWFVASKRIDPKASDRIINSKEVDAEMQKLALEDHRALVEFGLIMGVIPALGAIAFAALIEGRSPTEPLHRLARVRGALKPVEQNPAWTGVMDIIEAVADQKIGWRDIIAQCKRNQSVSDSAAAVAAVTLLTMLDPSMPLPQVFGSFCTVGSVLEPVSKYPLSVYERHFTELTTAYWLQKFEKSRFLFRSPATVEQPLKVAATGNRAARAKAILRAVRSGFNAQLPDSVSRWIESS